MKPALVAVLALVGVACGQSETAAVVNGEDIARSTLDALHSEPSNLAAEERAASTYLLVLHNLVVSNALDEFDISPDPADVETAFFDRVAGAGDDIDVRLANRGITRQRVTLEAELDVLRATLETEFILRGGPGVDLEASYRRFISLNSVACVTLLAPESNAAVPEIEVLVAAGASLEDVADAVTVEEIDLGCTNPVQHPLPVQPVAVDGEVGVAYLREFSDGTVFVVGVTERDAPTIDEVEDEVIQLAADSQGRDLFDQWAFDLLRSAEVEIDPSIGTWEASAETDGVPTVLAP